MLSDRVFLSCLCCLSVIFVHRGQTVGRIKMKLGTQVGLGPGHIVLDGDPTPPPQRGTAPPISGPYLLRPNGCVDQDATIYNWYGARPRPSWRLCVRWEPRLPSPKRGRSHPNFRPICLCWPNGWMDQDGFWHGGRPQPRRLCVKWGPSPFPKRGRSSPPQFSAHVYCGQTAGWIRMALGMEVGLGPGHIVLDGDTHSSPSQKGAEPPPQFWPYSIVAKRLYGSRCHLVRRLALAQATLCLMGSQLPPKGAQPPVFGSCLLWLNGWMDEGAILYGRDLGPGHIVLDGDPAPPRKGHNSASPSFRPMSIVATVARLSYC